MTSRALTDWIFDTARTLGFMAAGIAAVEPMDSAPFRAWLEAGYGAEMAYLHRHVPLRAQLDAVLPGAKSVICVALPYPGPTTGEAPLVARYARGEDYHDVVAARLQELHDALRSQIPDAEGRIFVDAGPLPERELARRAGIGWPGKHSCLIAKELGTRFVLGEILTTAALDPSTPAVGSCGNCTRCLSACPTGAIVAAGVVDARRCVSYLTIEQKGPIPRELRPLIGTRLFGCDTCQDSCPYNQGVGELTTPLHPAEDLLVPDLSALLALTPEAFNRRFRGTSLHRTKRRGLLRNACVVLGNLRDRAALPALRLALQDTEALVRGHAVWALGRLGDTQALTSALMTETEPWVREEIMLALHDKAEG